VGISKHPYPPIKSYTIKNISKFSGPPELFFLAPPLSISILFDKHSRSKRLKIVVFGFPNSF